MEIIYQHTGHYNGDELQINYEILSNSSFSFSWDTLSGNVALINLEYKCFGADDVAGSNKKVLKLIYVPITYGYNLVYIILLMQESEVLLPLSDSRHGSQEVIINDVAAPIQCVVFGCYMDDFWYDIYLIKSKQFVLQVEPTSSLMASLSPTPSPSTFPETCDCDNINLRNKREAMENGIV